MVLLGVRQAGGQARAGKAGKLPDGGFGCSRETGWFLNGFGAGAPVVSDGSSGRAAGLEFGLLSHGRLDE